MTVNSKIETPSTKKGIGVVRFFREVKAEVKKITWPSKENTKKAILAVAAFTLISLVLIGAMDYIFQNLFELVFKLK
ncbi:protein translocase subunit secE/sec61 gamma [Clostridium cavendishii DSM 21758]|uniref:Protein translocase subunit SecE n=1 Tax=Clostridium cavendishii DSM 21758 TaxID=1121302 RepID=A0A1M6VI29_9CLOT|nr:preprotein translocase subunit SecE [Clostridium cavendishii]SHK81163.1 protein translocase subunit secE/sec61 gamma [Clostridium cavendishii DSM 21758]